MTLKSLLEKFSIFSNFISNFIVNLIKCEISINNVLSNVYCTHKVSDYLPCHMFDITMIHISIACMFYSSKSMNRLLTLTLWYWSVDDICFGRLFNFLWNPFFSYLKFFCPFRFNQNVNNGQHNIIVWYTR